MYTNFKCIAADFAAGYPAGGICCRKLSHSGQLLQAIQNGQLLLQAIHEGTTPNVGYPALAAATAGFSSQGLLLL